MPVCTSDPGGGRISVRLRPDTFTVFQHLGCFKELPLDHLMWRYVHRGLLNDDDECLRLEASLVDVPELARSVIAGFLIEVSRREGSEESLESLIRKYIHAGMKADLASPTAWGFCKWLDERALITSFKEMKQRL